MKLPPFDSKKHQKEFIESIIIFVYEHLCKWRNDIMRPTIEGEKILNSDLPKFLTSYAHETELSSIVFYPEEPQEGQRTVDFSVCFNNVQCYNKVITVFECKRLSKTLPKDRKDEYVTGYKKTTGGIQRFKLEVHGKDHEIVSMIGYVQTGICSEWQKTINNCIDDLCNKPDENGLCWIKDEHLKAIEFDKKKGKSYCKSIHPRITKPNITIHHLWVNMQKNEVTLNQS